MIAYDNATNSAETTGTSKTFSHTCTGANLWLGVGDTSYLSANDACTGMTYAGVSMASMQNVASATTRQWYYGLIAPATGANNVVISFNASTASQASAHSYTGCGQTSQPDASGSTFTNLGTTLSKSLTTTADNCWIVGTAQNTAAGMSAHTGTTQRTGAAGFGAFDNNAALTPPGSFSLGVDTAGAGTITLCVATIAPPAPPAAAVIPKIIIVM